MKGNVIKLRFTYHEIMDRDFTAVDVEVFRGQRCVANYSNYDEMRVAKEIFANQTEEFLMPSLKAARKFLESSGRYFCRSI